MMIMIVYFTQLLSQIFKQYLRHSLIFISILICYEILEIDVIHAKVRPSDISQPTDINGLGRGYASPPPRFKLHLLHSFQSSTTPFEQRRLFGLDFQVRAPYGSNEIGVRWVIFNHALSNDVINQSAMRASHIVLDWRWIWGNKKNRPYVGVGIALPSSELSNDLSDATFLKLDSTQALAGTLGGLDPWLWTHNTASLLVQAGWSTTNAKGIRFEIDSSFAHLSKVITHDAINSFNHVQVKSMVGYDGSTFSLVLGGAYAMQVGGESEDPNQISGHLRLGYKGEAYHYIVGGVYNIDAPYGSDGLGFWGVILGLESY
jgi:hypothetical protein